MKLLSRFLPRVIYETTSAINGKIQVIEFMGRRRLFIGGLTQSGGMVEEIWKKGINKAQSFPRSGIPPKAVTRLPGLAKATRPRPSRDEVGKPRAGKAQRCLILGLGAGTLAKIIAKTYPGAKIVGVEIDPVIVNIGERFFGLSEIKNLKIVIADAASWIREIKSHNGFDLIVVDTYLGDKFPKSCQTDRFFKKLSQILSRNGFIIFNVLADKIHLFEAGNFLDKTSKIFNDVRRIKVNKNWLISIRKPVDTFGGAKLRTLVRSKERRSVSTLSMPRSLDRGVEWVD